MTDRRRFLLQLGALGVAAGIGAHQAEARQRIRLTRHRSTTLFDSGASPLLVAHLTDLHVGIATPRNLLEQAVEEARRARPDLTVLTGDYLNHSLHHLDRLRALVRDLPRPCLATLGNHDHWSGATQIRQLLEREGIGVLCNASTVLTLRGRRLTVVGVDDGMTRHADVRRALAGVVPGRALILAHYPNWTVRSSP
jgi:predicted MPP superfamily phosphohydrolase